MKNKKSLGTVIGVVLLLTVSVSFLIFYNNWANYFFSKVSTKHYDIQNEIKAIKLENNLLYFKNYNNNTFNIIKLNINNISCSNFSPKHIEVGISFINITNCSIPDSKVYYVDFILENDAFFNYITSKN